ncbi:hypothetical protein OUZ56_009826 [Daphnia magna]|uniref:Uncharacterized protein n=1 Tax=Daphnia magna TaxID=35525 RepID=A0ABR0AGZ3_9CRUS|nr:hypothetical protein OUZ56_009826 [Daphnia magna]
MLGFAEKNAKIHLGNSFSWRFGIINHDDHPLTYLHVSLQHFGIKGCFVAGAPGYITQNINPSLGLSNGTSVIYHSLTLSPLEDMHSVMEMMLLFR